MRWIWLAFFLSSGHNGAWQSREGDQATPAGGDGARPGGGPPTNAEDPEASAAEAAASSAFAGALTCILSVFFLFPFCGVFIPETGPIDSLIDQLRRGRGGGTVMGHGIGSLRRDAHARKPDHWPHHDEEAAAAPMEQMDLDPEDDEMEEIAERTTTRCWSSTYRIARSRGGPAQKISVEGMLAASAAQAATRAASAAQEAKMLAVSAANEAEAASAIRLVAQAAEEAAAQAAEEAAVQEAAARAGGGTGCRGGGTGGSGASC